MTAATGPHREPPWSLFARCQIPRFHRWHSVPVYVPAEPKDAAPTPTACCQEVNTAAMSSSSLTTFNSKRTAVQWPSEPWTKPAVTSQDVLFDSKLSFGSHIDFKNIIFTPGTSFSFLLSQKEAEKFRYAFVIQKKGKKKKKAKSSSFWSLQLDCPQKQAAEGAHSSSGCHAALALLELNLSYKHLTSLTLLLINTCPPERCAHPPNWGCSIYKLYHQIVQHTAWGRKPREKRVFLSNVQRSGAAVGNMLLIQTTHHLASIVLWHQTTLLRRLDQFGTLTASVSHSPFR